MNTSRVSAMGNGSECLSPYRIQPTGLEGQFSRLGRESHFAQHAVVRPQEETTASWVSAMLDPSAAPKRISAATRP